MGPRTFVLLMVITAVAVWIGDRVATTFAAPGMERTFAVLVVAAAILAPAAWLLGRLGMIRKGNVELGRKRPADAPPSDGSGR